MARVSASEVSAYQPEQIDEPKDLFDFQPNIDQIDAPYDGEIDLEEAAEAGEGCTFGDVAKMCLRVAAGVVGMPIYGLMLGSTALLSICITVPGIILGLPFAALGACIGAALALEDGALNGAIVGVLIGGFPLFLVELVSYLPKLILVYTIGAVSVGLTSYALYGTLEKVVETESPVEDKKVGYSELMYKLKFTGALSAEIFPICIKKIKG